MQVKIKLKPNDIVNIYTNYQEEEGYEGKAILLEKIKDGDSFYLRNERVKIDDKKTYTKEEEKEITYYSRLIRFLKGSKTKSPEKECKALYRDLKKQIKDKLTDFSKMDKVVEKYRKKYSSSPRYIGTVLSEYSNDYLIRFVHQDRDGWQPSIFASERWKVRFIEDNYGWEVDFTTNRNVRVLKCVNPSEGTRRSQLVEFTTYDGISSRNYDRIIDKMAYHKRKEKEKEASFIDDEEMEKLIFNKLKNVDNESRNSKET